MPHRRRYLVNLATLVAAVAVALQLGGVALALQFDRPTGVLDSDVERWVRLLPEAAPESEATKKLVGDALDGTLDEFSLLQAALIAGGLDDARLLSSYQARFEGWSEDLDRRGWVVGDSRAKAEAVFRYLHGEILVGRYEREATDLALTLHDGRFNCVSSLVLFMGLAERNGLDVRAVELPGHVFCRLRTADEVVDIETTCKTWFDEVARQGTRRVGEEQAPHVSPLGPRVYGNAAPREIEPPQLLAIIFYNRGVELLARNEHRAAVAANLTAFRLDPFSDAVRGNLTAAVNNWALALTRAGRYAAATDLLTRGLVAAPDYEFFRQNDVYVQQQWIAALCSQGQHRQALWVLGAAQRRRPGVRYLDRAQQEQLEQAAAGVGRENRHRR